MLGKEMPEAKTDDPVAPGQWSDDRIPDTEVAESAVHTDERGALAQRDIGDVIPVDATIQHALSPSGPAQHGPKDTAEHSVQAF
jgi:hypothetical protein